MKLLLTISPFYFVLSISMFAQTGSINNTLGTGGSFVIKDGANNYLRVDQATDNSVFLRNLELGNIDNSILGVGVITKNNKRFMHNFAPNGSEFNNLFIGLEAGNFTMGGGTVSYQSSYNTGIGSNSLSSITTGYSNTALGSRSLLSNTTGYDNTAIGYCPLYNNILGSSNVAIGTYALFNSTKSGNCAVGRGALLNCNGGYNTAIGLGAGSSVTTGNNNILIGWSAGPPNGATDNQVRIGNTEISYAGIQVAWSITSDRRWKDNINPSNLGLDFITKLNPVSYRRKNDKCKKVEYGLIAQELEEVLKLERVENTGMLTITDDGYYELRYNDLFAPIIKAIQDLKKEKDDLQSKYEKLYSFNQELAIKNELLTKEINSIKTSISEEIEFQVKSILSKTQKQENENNKLTLGN